MQALDLVQARRWCLFGNHRRRYIDNWRHSFACRVPVRVLCTPSGNRKSKIDPKELLFFAQENSCEQNKKGERGNIARCQIFNVPVRERKISAVQ